MNRCKSKCRGLAVVRLGAAAAAFIFALPAGAQQLSVLPVNIFFPPGERAALLTVTNTGDKPTSIQIRSYEWTQKDNNDALTPTDAVLVSPPLARIAPASSQVVRLVLRRAAQDRELTYRIILDQIPGASEPGVVQMVLRFSIPIFSAPPVRVTPKLQCHIEREGDKWVLVAANDGLTHDTLRDIAVLASGGRKYSAGSHVSPYVLAGATRRLEVDAGADALRPGETVKVTANAITGPIKMEAGVAAAP